MFNQSITVTFSAHQGTYRENIGDVLSASSIPILRKSKNYQIRCLPSDYLVRSDSFTVYGGGGMIRPNFAKREIWADVLCQKHKYDIQGVGINKDLDAPEYTKDDIDAIREWFMLSENCSVRDFRSQEMIHSICGITPKFEPCPSFQILRSLDDQPNSGTKKIGIVLSSGHTKTYKNRLDSIEKIVLFIISYIGKEKTAIICHDYKDYLWSSERFPCAIDKPSNLSEVKFSYSKCERIVSMRGHGVIFAAACNIPATAIPFCDKIEALFEAHYGASLPQIRIEEPLRTIKKFLNCFFTPKKLEWSIAT